MCFIKIKKKDAIKYAMISASEPYTLYLPAVIQSWDGIGYKCIVVIVYYAYTSYYHPN